MNLGAAEVLTIVVGVVAVVAFLIWGNRPTPERFAEANGLTLDDETRAEVAAALRRTYRGRVLGGGASFLVTLAFAVVEGTRLNYTRGLAAILAGTLIGISLAQFTRPPATGTIRVASLEARRPDDYRPRRAKLTIGVSIGVLLAYAAACLAWDASGRFLVFVILVPTLVVASVVLGVWLQSRIVEHAQLARDAEHARVDDALRASAVRAVHHATIGIVLCGIAFLGVTAAAWSTTEVMAGSHVAFEIRGATNLATSTDPVGSNDATVDRIWWTDFDGVRHSRVVPGLTGYQQTSAGPAPLGGLLALVTGIGALFEWRAAARAWRAPGRRRRRAGDVPDALAAAAGAA